MAGADERECRSQVERLRGQRRTDTLAERCSKEYRSSK